MKVRIFQPAKTAMQSGRSKTKRWCLRFDEYAPKFVEPIMGWVGQSDTQQQLNLMFDTKEEAIAYAERKGYAYEVILPQQRTVKPKSYAENFSYTARLKPLSQA